ncbi:hypothetical protein [Sporotomaculum syntrophicum]|uniref:hypothetical protein n=1 Tax=Sporotomaculum syntrophicum TaxID=182264 RepID=UPI0013796EC4|nr:hypothetical protein [Sporotomaculum syntrophicum]
MKGVPEPQEESRLMQSVSKACPRREGCLYGWSIRVEPREMPPVPGLMPGRGVFIFLNRNA